MGQPSALLPQESQGNEGGRRLTANEIAEARKAYGDQIDYSKPRVFGEKYFPFQGAETAMAPDGNVYFPLAKGCADLTACSIPVPGKPGAQYDILGTFIHEMGHVMQHQQGVNVLGRGFLLQTGRILSGGLYNPYSYPAGANPSQLNIEAQAQYYRDQYCAANPGC
jgi:type VI secretion system secreted protein VgrG